MQIEKTTIRMTVRKIVKRKPIYGGLQYDLYFTVPSIHPRVNKVKEASIVGPIVCVTEKHHLPTIDGYKVIEDVMVGDVILCSLDLITT
jgi:hypothetical protein